ncbi:MAG: hypothetical protein LBN23_02815 [Paludibacter sp.]|jgi:cell division protein FtsQ|nr:hypothetical protein [Paludibacter sp.]
MKIKKVISIILKALAATVVVAYMAFAFIVFADADRDTECSELNINFNNAQDSYLLTKEEITHILDRRNLNPAGETYFHTKTDSIEKLLHRNPMISAVECYKTLSGKVKLNIEQKEPKFIVVSGKGAYYVDNRRDTVPYSLNFKARLPVVTGATVYPEMSTESIFDFVDYVQKSDFWNAQIEQIDVIQNNGDEPKIELVTRVGDAIIHIGTLDNFEQKLQKMYYMFKDGFSKIGWNNYDFINLEYDGQIVCRKKNQSNSGMENY